MSSISIISAKRSDDSSVGKQVDHDEFHYSFTIDHGQILLTMRKKLPRKLSNFKRFSHNKYETMDVEEA